MKQRLTKNLSLAIIGTLATGMATSCVDDNYDLSDVDTTVRVQVNDLTVPVNIDEITLESIFDLKKDDHIEIIDGKYTVIYEGDYNSSPINEKVIELRRPTIQSTHVTIGAVPGGNIVHYPVDVTPSTFSYNATNVTEDIISIDQVKGIVDMTVNIKLTGAKDCDFTLSDGVVQLPKGLVFVTVPGKYDATTGHLELNDNISFRNNLTFQLQATAIDFAKSGAVYDRTKHTVVFNGQIGLLSGDITVDAAKATESVQLDIDYTMNDVRLTSFSGEITHSVSGVHFDPVNLSSLPDVLRQKGTDIRLLDPQIYLDVLCPVSQYGLSAQAGMRIQSLQDGKVVNSVEPSSLIVTGTDDPAGNYSFWLAPSDKNPIQTPGKYIEFKGLQDILAGNGLPDKLDISILDPSIPQQHVTDFPLGTSIGALSGKYKFYAPIELMDGSTIVYSDIEDGWNTEDVDKITVTKMTVKGVVNTTIPVALHITGYPVDTKGQQINNVQITGCDVPPYAKDYELTLVVTGEFTHLDGIEFRAEARAEGDAEALRPDMSIKLTKIRPTVTGYYDTTL